MTSETPINALTVDVEDYFHVSAFSSVIHRQDWDLYKCRVEANTRALLELFARRDVRATFFVLGWVAERYPELIREVAAQGHEIACHGLSHELVYRQTPEVFREETYRAKSVLEDVVQVPVAGYRAASYSIVKQSRWALDVLVDLGFKYDSSIFPVRHDRYGIPDAPRRPYKMSFDGGAELVEFPLSTYRIGSYQLPVSGGGYFRLFPYAFTRHALRRINRREKLPFIFYLHPWEIDPAQPRVRAGAFSRFRHYNNLDRCYSRLESLLSDFRFASVHDVLRQMGLLGAGGTAAHAPARLAADVL